MPYFTQSRSFYSYTLILVFMFTFSSCRRPQQYAERAYLKKRAEEALPSPEITLNQPTRDDVRLPTHDYRYDQWEKQPYESVEQWSNRLEESLEMNHSRFLDMKQIYEAVEVAEQERISKIQEMKKINFYIKGLLEKANSFPDQIDETLRPIVNRQPFTIHLVTRDETLYSISMKYYGNGKRVKDIIQWNQGWIRSPNTLMAGLALVLFLDDSKVERGPTAVNSYIQTIQKSLDTDADQ